MDTYGVCVHERKIYDDASKHLTREERVRIETDSGMRRNKFHLKIPLGPAIIK